MSTTVSEIVSEAISRYPTLQLLDDSTIARRLTQIFRKVYPYIGTITKAHVTVSADGAYTVATDFRSDNLKRILWFNQDEGDGETAGTPFTESDIDEAIIEEFNDKVYLQYRGSPYTIATVYYLPTPSAVSVDSSEWDLTELPIDDEYTDLLTFGLIAELATFGDVPDISIANNYERQFNEVFARTKGDYYRRNQRNKKNKIKHEDIW